MTQFGTVKSFDETTGYGTIQSEAGGGALPFDPTAVTWGNATSLVVDRRLTYDIGLDNKGDVCAVNIQPA